VAQRARRGLEDYTAEALLMVLVLALAGAAFFVGWIIGRYANPSTKTKTVTVAAPGAPATPAGIAAAPPFTAAELAALPKENWLTNGGSLEPALRAARPDRHGQRRRAEGRLAHAPARVGDRGEVLR
jgi:hypothetical protein